MRKSGVLPWFQKMSFDFKDSLNNGMTNMLKLVDATNASITESRRVQHRLGHFSLRPVASLTNAKTEERAVSAIRHYVCKAKDLVTSFQNALPDQSTGSFTPNWSALCNEAIDIISEMGGMLVVLALEVDDGTRTSVADAKSIAKADMEEAVKRSMGMKWLY